MNTHWTKSWYFIIASGEENQTITKSFHHLHEFPLNTIMLMYTLIARKLASNIMDYTQQKVCKDFRVWEET